MDTLFDCFSMLKSSNFPLMLNDPDAGVVDCASFALWAIGKSKADEKKLRDAVNGFDEKIRRTFDLWED